MLEYRLVNGPTASVGGEGEVNDPGTANTVKTVSERFGSSFAIDQFSVLPRRQPHAVIPQEGSAARVGDSNGWAGHGPVGGGSGQEPSLVGRRAPEYRRQTSGSGGKRRRVTGGDEPWCNSSIEYFRNGRARLTICRSARRSTMRGFPRLRRSCIWVQPTAPPQLRRSSEIIRNMKWFRRCPPCSVLEKVSGGVIGCLYGYQEGCRRNQSPRCTFQIRHCAASPRNCRRSMC